MSEDDTFRVLTRKPIEEVHELLRWEVTTVSAAKFKEIVKSHGYTMAEYYRYDATVKWPW